MKRLLLLSALILLCAACTHRQKIVEKKEINSYYDKAFEFRENGKSDSSFFYFNEARNLFVQQKDSLGIAKCLVNMAIISANNGDYFGSQELSLSAQSYFHQNDKQEHTYIKSNLNNLGIAFYNLKNYSRAIEFYEKSISYTSDSILLLGIKNNIANAYRRLKQYNKSMAIYSDILKQPLSTTEYAKVLSNYTYTGWLKDANFNAAPGLLKALQLRKKEKDSLGLNSSYAQLSDYYATKQPDSALQYAKAMHNLAKNSKNRDDEVEALQKVIKLSPGDESKKYFLRYDYISDSLQTERRAAGNQFAVIRYESEKNRVENLNLQKENTEKEYQVATRELFLLIGLISVIAAVITTIIWYKKRKQKLKSDAQQAITDSKLKTSKKVHDVVANGLYRVMTEIENQQDLDRNHVLDKIEDLYEKSRDISYEKPTEANKPFHETLSEILTSFATENRKVLIAGNDAELWQRVSERTKYELEHIIQELMVNMKKHSQASNVVMRFENNGEQIKIYYTDNGVGMPKDKGFNNGLRNTGNRIEEINGAIIFDTEVEKGFKIQISFPIS